MTSGYFYGGVGEINTRRSTMTPMNNLQSQIQLPYRSPLSGMLPDNTSTIIHRRPAFSGKRSLAEFQQQQQLEFLHQQQIQQELGYHRSVKSRSFQSPSPSPLDFSISSLSSDCTPISNTRHGVPIFQTLRSQPVIPTANTNVNRVISSVNPNSSAVASYLNQVQNSLFQESEEKMMNQLHELEKQLLNDEDIEDDTVSVVTNSEWSDTIQSLITPCGNHLSPASSTSSCSSSMESPPATCPKQSIVEAATAISEGKIDAAEEILTRLEKVANINGSSEQRLTVYMISALRSRVNPTRYPPPVLELHSKEHTACTQSLYEVSPCYKLGFMAANLAIIEAVANHASKKLHIIDFNIGQGGQYLHLLHTLATRKADKLTPTVLKITAVTDFMGIVDDAIEEDLKTLANKVGLCLIFNVISCKVTELSRENLGIEQDEALAVNFSYKLYRLPDESVTMENLRDELLRRVKGLSPNVVTLVEQELNWNTAALVARVNEACRYYGALLDSLNATVSNYEMCRVKLEDGLSRKIANSVACEGRERVERCEVFGKWRARMCMAGFGPRPMSQLVADSLRRKLNAGPRGNPGFSVNEQSGGICFGWKEKVLTIASAWC